MLKKKRIFIAGDSTACIYPHCGEGNRFPRTGWGQVIDRFLPEYTIVDLALSGRSMKSFKTEDNFKYLCKNISHGDLLIIQFGHNDSKIDKPDIYAAADSEYKELLREFINIARHNGAAPILATSISRNRASDASLEEYVNAVRQVADEQVVTLMDLYDATNRYINSIGTAAATEMFMNISKQDERFIDDIRYEGSEFYDKYTQDNTHLNINGALIIAEMAADMIHDILDR